MALAAVGLAGAGALLVAAKPAEPSQRPIPGSAAQSTAPVHHSSPSKGAAPPRAVSTASPKPSPPKTDHPLYAEYAAGPNGEFSAKHPWLERVLELEKENSEWSEHVQTGARELLRDHPEIQTDVRCVQTFCRLHVVKPVYSAMRWPELDRKLSQLRKGEKIFQTETNDGVPAGYMYFAADGARLPLGDPESDDQVPEL